MTLSKIEKCARLMGYERDGESQIYYRPINVNAQQIESGDYPIMTFNPLTNKSDLVDLMCAVGIDFQWHDDAVLAICNIQSLCEWGYFKDHPNKKTALAHAVVDVAEQIYDRKFGDKE